MSPSPKTTNNKKSDTRTGERLPLLAPNARTRPFTTPTTASPTSKKALLNSSIRNNQNNNNNKPIRPTALSANSNLFQKQSRPRKAVSEFVRKKKKTRHGYGWSGRVGIHLHVDEIDIEKVTEAFSEKQGWDAADQFEVVRLWQTEPPYIGHEMWSDGQFSEDEEMNGAGTETTAAADDVTTAMSEIYLFSFGACVFWNFPSEEHEKEWISKTLLNGELEDVCGDPYKDEEIESAMDSISFQYGAEQFSMKQDVCRLCTRDAGEKLAVSFALAKSSLLSLYELRVQNIIERNSHLPEEMVKSGRIKMSIDDLSREVGRLFLVKHGINLDQSLIDTPEEFWEDDRFEPTYDTTIKYLKISKRLDLVNNRLDMIGELHNKIMDENHEHHAVLLEWIIIVLIVVEVLLDMLHLGFY